jgi:two-component system, OmpR family, response regulator ChvI
LRKSEKEIRVAQTIAHVDDDPDIRQAVRTILEAEGYAVENYAMMSVFLAAIDKMHNLPSLVILDVMVEKDDSGLGAYDILRARFPRLPVILLTSLGEMVRPYFEEEHAKVWIVEKPVTAEKLLAIIQAHIKNADTPAKNIHTAGE